MNNNNFDKPLNVWTEEEVEVPTFKPVLNEKENRIEIVQSTTKLKQSTIYVDSKPSTIVCKEHTYFCKDKGKSLFKCKNCTWHRIALPVTFKFDSDTGILTRRLTGERV